MGQPSPAQISEHELGQVVHLVATVVGTDGVTAVQPSSFTFYVKNPLGSVASYVFGVAAASVVNPTTGVFTKDISLDPTTGNVGSWFYEMVATGLVQAAKQWSFMVAPSFIL